MKNCLGKNNPFLFIGVFILAVVVGLVSTMRGSDFLGILFSVILFLGFFVFFARYSD